MIESFDDAIAFAQATMSDCDTPILDRLKRAHDHEIVEALCDACDQCDRMDKKAHDHEIEQMRKAEFARGYEDAEHAAVALRLSRLRFDGGSHENLSKIAYAVYPCATGLTCESAKGLRDRLIDLLGGVHEHHCDSGRGCACGNRDSGDSGELAEAMTYDVLGNERHKVVCKLREFVPMIGHKPTEEASKLIRCITGNDDSHVACGNDLEETRDRLIHLLGGDEPTLSDLYDIWRDAPDSQESPILANSGVDDGGKVTITAEFREAIETATKTYEGSWYEMNDADHTICHITEGELLVIADRMDEQAKTLEHDVEMWRDRSEDMRMERDELKAKMNAMREVLDG